MDNSKKVKHSFPILKTIGGHEFIVDLITDSKTLDDVFALRYQIFNIELKEGLRASEKTHRDIDPYDQFCDHLAVIDRTKNQLIATYRLLPFEKAQANIGFYGETEFDLSEIHKKLPNSLEIGRSCVHQDYRNGSIISLLWYGIRAYMVSNDVNFTIGCTSLDKGSDALYASKIYQLFKQLNANGDHIVSVKPLANKQVKGFDPDIQLSNDEIIQLRRSLPSIFRGYMALDAKFSGHPAYDEEFDVIDFFCVFDYSAISKIAKRFSP